MFSKQLQHKKSTLCEARFTKKFRVQLFGVKVTVSVAISRKRKVNDKKKPFILLKKSWELGLKNFGTFFVKTFFVKAQKTVIDIATCDVKTPTCLTQVRWHRMSARFKSNCSGNLQSDTAVMLTDPVVLKAIIKGQTALLEVYYTNKLSKSNV